MKLTLTTEKNYLDAQGFNWTINANKELPIIKQHMDKIISITKQAIRLYKNPIAYHFWIRVNEDSSIIKFTDLLRKKFLRSNNLNIQYIRVKEYDNEKYHHHHFFVFLDRAVTHPNSLSYFLANNTGKNKALLFHEVCKSRTKKKPFMTMANEEEVKDVVNRASYLAKVRSKILHQGVRQISTSHILQ